MNYASTVNPNNGESDGAAASIHLLKFQ